jgi:hypothetical protein
VSGSNFDTGFPAAPLTDDTGQPTPAWRAFFRVLWARTGQVGAPAIGAAGATLLPSATLTPTASPYSYTAKTAGTLYVAGGGVTSMTITRGSGTAFPVGAFYGGKRLCAGDVLTVSYSHIPTLHFLPG